MSDFKEIAGIKVDQRDKVASELSKAREAAKVERAGLQTLRESANEEGVEFKPGSEAFEKVNAQSKAYTVAKQSADELELAYKALLDIDGALAGTVADGVAVQTQKDGDRTKRETGRRMSIVSQAVERFMEAPEYQAVRERYAQGIISGRPSWEVSNVITREQMVGIIRQASGDSLLTGASDTLAGSFVWPEQDQRLVDLVPLRTPRVLDVVNTTTTNSDTIEYVTVTAKTNNAAATAEVTVPASTGNLAESAYTTAVATAAVENIGHFIAATSRALADAGQLDGLLRTFLMDGVMVALEDQILTGNGSTPNLSGIYTDVTQGQAVGADSRSDAVLKAQTAIRVNAAIKDTVTPNTIVLHPNDYQDLRLEKDDIGNYTFGGPTAPAMFPVWGMTPVQALGATSGTPIVGDFRFAQLWVREGVSVSVSDSNSDWFIRNILTLKAQMRAAFKTTRIAAFCEITGF